MTWATDADIDARDALARTALSAYSQAAVDRGDSAITTYEGLRTLAQAQILLDLSGRDIEQADITNTSAMMPVEVLCVLWVLFEAVSQYTTDLKDVYAARALKNEGRYKEAVSIVNPVASVRGVGCSFSWDRG